MAKLWSGAYSEMSAALPPAAYPKLTFVSDANDATAVSQFGWIPEAMFQCLQKDVSIEMKWVTFLKLANVAEFK